MMNKTVMLNDTLALSHDCFWELVEVFEDGRPVVYLIEYASRELALRGLYDRLVSSSVPSRCLVASDSFRCLSVSKCFICGSFVSPESPDYPRGVHTRCEVNQ